MLIFTVPVETMFCNAPQALRNKERIVRTDKIRNFIFAPRMGKDHCSYLFTFLDQKSLSVFSTFPAGICTSGILERSARKPLAAYWSNGEPGCSNLMAGLTGRKPYFMRATC